MTSSSRRLAATAVLAAVALTGAACSTKLSTSSPPSTTAAPTTTIPGSSTPAQTKASDYRAQLTYLMVEHVYLLGRVTAEVVAAGGIPSSSAASATTTTSAPATPTSSSVATSSTATTTTTTTVAATTTTEAATAAGPLSIPGADDAATALDKNSHDIADLLAQAQGYGSTFSDSFYQLWSARIGDVADYATAKVAKDSSGATAANSALTANALALATLFHQTNKYLAVNTVDKSGVDDELGPDNAAVTTFVDAQASKAATALSALVAAAELMRHTSVVFAAAAAKLDPDQYPGTATGTAANLRASITAALVEHVELAALTTDPLVAGQSAAVPAASLADNSGQLDNVVTVNFGDPAGETFASLWGSYVSSLEGYARSKAGGGTAPDLSGVGQQIGAFLGAQAPQLSASVLGSDVQALVDTLKAVVDDAGSQTPEVIALRVAAATVPKLGSDLAEGIAEDKPKLYLP